ncbi:unnamed protein product [Amoebophrya sp. A25]|nr:unnamed protein product [Amoebophrya sp. A25]|eukprot:GSA25T00008076001.1
MTEKVGVDFSSAEYPSPPSRPSPFVQPVANGSTSYEDMVEAVDGVYKTLNHPTPDFMFFSPLVGNCMLLEKLGRSRDDQGTNRKRNPQLAPKLIAVPINPLVPPPFEFVPDFNAWHERELEQGDKKPQDSAWLFTQCSVAAAARILEKQGYALLQIDHALALFGRKLGPATRFGVGPLLPQELWLQGWHCSPAARTFLALEWKSGLDVDFLTDNEIDPVLRQQELCRFVDRFSLPMVWRAMPTLDCSKVAEKLSAEEDEEAEEEVRAGLVVADGSRDTITVLSEAEVQVVGQQEEQKNKKDSQTGAVVAVSFPAHTYRTLDPKTSSSLFGDLNLYNGRTQLLFLREWDTTNPRNELGKKFLLESQNRGRCLDDLGICECFIPWRGRFCEQKETLKSLEEIDETSGKLKKGYKAALHYLVGDSPRLLRDMRLSLQILWRNFNSRHEYPVVIFHDGLSPSARQILIESSPNKLWFAFVEDYTSIPEHLKNKIPQNDFAGYNLGYRGMCRFRSGPIFLHPVLKDFDYAWTLDTDGYFPAPVEYDPIQRMHDQNLIYMYSHISRDQAGQVQHFWEFLRMYIEHKGYDKKGTKLMRRITDALVMRDTYWHEWNRLLFMNDIELVRLSWFQADLYQEYFRFLDSLGGFWLYRWGDHGIRTIAIAMHLGEEYLAKLDVPYSHQGACVCASENKKCVKRKDKKKQDSDLPDGEDVSRSYKFECVYRQPGEEVDPEDASFGVVDPVRFFGGT